MKAVPQFWAGDGKARSPYDLVYVRLTARKSCEADPSVSVDVL